MEPVILGLIVAPSSAGFALALTALLGFVAHTPLKIALVDRLRHRRLERTRLAEQVAVIELISAGSLLALAVILAEDPFWLPLVIAAPLIAVELWYDVRSRSRRLVPELAGTIGIGSMAATIALAGGSDGLVAAGLWAIAAARAVAAVVFVRVQLRRAKGQPLSPRQQRHCAGDSGRDRCRRLCLECRVPCRDACHRRARDRSRLARPIEAACRARSRCATSSPGPQRGAHRRPRGRGALTRATATTFA